MKTLLVSTLVLLLSAGGAALAAEPSTSSPQASAYAIRVNTVDCNGWEIVRGMPAQRVLNRCGLPDTRLSPDVWVYRRFHAVPGRPEARDCTVLVVTLAEGRVADLHLVNDRAVAILTARLERDIPATLAMGR